MAAARDRQKSYADKRRKPLEFQMGDRVLLKVSPWKGVIRFGKLGKLNPRYIGPFEITKRISPVTYELQLPQELSSVHNVFHVSNLKKCLSNETLAIPLEEIQIDEQLHFVEEPVEIMDREIKKLKLSKIPNVKEPIAVRDGPTGVPVAVRDRHREELTPGFLRVARSIFLAYCRGHIGAQTTTITTSFLLRASCPEELEAVKSSSQGSRSFRR
ncbi:hypothetical protein E3N88_24200 [Mikania micrantha]|uniref:Tf2-1-like SH3-like domain-containing protein n=1 Tax=Mikania micrantha TaxID=192012 RepID=A0A5N6NGJ6_9ASTR|nr:hypothetical protein E3N88_24200 [Mikania micrantha]